jgi:hypothetical protein
MCSLGYLLIEMLLLKQTLRYRECSAQPNLRDLPFFPLSILNSQFSITYKELVDRIQLCRETYKQFVTVVRQ